MSEKGPNTGAVILGIFFLLFGICTLLAGGGCTIVLIGLMVTESSGDALGVGLPLLLVSLAVAAVGFFCTRFGIRLFRGPAAPSEPAVQPPPPPPRTPEV